MDSGESIFATDSELLGVGMGIITYLSLSKP